MNKIVAFKKILPLHFVEVSSSPHLPPVFVIVLWGKTNRSSLSQMFFKICVNISVRISFNKAAGLNTCNVIKNWLQHRCFPVKFVKFLRTPFFAELFRWLPLKYLISWFEKIQQYKITSNNINRNNMLMAKTSLSVCKNLFDTPWSWWRDLVYLTNMDLKGLC